MGTVQGFMDDTQFILLKLAVAFGILLLVSSFLGVILDLAFFLSNRKLRYLWGFLLHILFGFFGGSVAAAASFINIVSGGFFGE